MASLSGQAFLAAVVTIALIVMVLMIILVIRRQRTSLDNDAFPSNEPCTSAPPVPSNLQVSNPQGDLLILEWDPVVGATSYLSQISTVQNFDDNDVLQERTTTGASAGFANIALGATYYFRTRSSNSCGDSAFSPEVSFRIEFIYPDTFILTNQPNPSAQICDNHNSTFVAAQTDTVRGSAFCDFVTGNFFAEPSDQSIRQSSRPTRCLTRRLDTTVGFDVCNGSNAQKWSYDGTDSSLCSATDLQNGCLQVVDTSNPPGDVFHGPKDNDPIDTWTILEV